MKRSKRSNAQIDRQRKEYRRNGKYALVNPCMACGKSAGVTYFSHPLTDTGGWNDIALVLCAKCSEATQEMTDPKQFLEYKKQFGDVADEAWGRVQEQRKEESKRYLKKKMD